MIRMLSYSSGDRWSVPGRVIPKTQKIILDAYLHYPIYQPLRSGRI